VRWQCSDCVLNCGVCDMHGSVFDRSKLKLIVGTNPVFVAVTKCDLLPLVNTALVRSWQELVEAHYGVNVVKLFPLSGLTRGGVFRMSKHLYRHVAEGKLR
jgi:hypothetical protein